MRPSDFRLTFAGEDFFWAGERRAGVPILRWPCGAICEPVLAYFGYSVEKRRVAISSMKDEAYALREWLAFMTSRNLEWQKADDTLLRLWRQSFEKSIKARELKKNRVERKVQVIFDFYRLIDKAWPFTAEGRGREPFVGPHGPITFKFPITPRDRARMMWSGSEWVPGRGGKRPTPDEAQVAKILAWLRAKSFRGRSLRTEQNADLQRELEAERNWLLGRCAAAGGLRAHELAEFSIHDLAAALERAGVILPSEGLDGIAIILEKRDTLLQALDELEATHRGNLFVDIVGKGRKVRRASFSVELVRDLLEIGVWTVRHRQLVEWGQNKSMRKQETGIFLSFTTKRHLTSGAVGDLFKGAFKACHINGSGHRLRAHYATMTAIRLLDLNIALNGYRYDDGVRTMTLVQVAEALGHSNVNTTVMHYVDMAILQRLGENKQKSNCDRRGLVDTIRKFGPSLTSSKCNLLRNLTIAVANAEDDSKILEFLTRGLADKRLILSNRRFEDKKSVDHQARRVLHLVE